MTDNKIVKALECCTGKDGRCEDCPYEECFTDDKNFLLEDALDLINRQKAEIERLTYYNENLRCANTDILGKHVDYIKEARVEAYKEFAERLKAHSRKMQSSEWSGEFWDRAVLVEDIDNLVKEMTEETKHD